MLFPPSSSLTVPPIPARQLPPGKNRVALPLPAFDHVEPGHDGVPLAIEHGRHLGRIAARDDAQEQSAGIGDTLRLRLFQQQRRGHRNELEGDVRL